MALNLSRAQVSKVYADFFKRQPSEAALNYWANLLDQGSSLKQVQGYILSTPEGKREVVNRVTELYQQKLGRAPDQAGLEFWSGQLTAGADFGSVVNDVATSREAQDFEATGVAAAAAAEEARRQAAIDAAVQTGSGTVGTDTGNGFTNPSTNAAEVDYSVIKTLLRDYGLEGLYDDAVAMIQGDDSPAEIELKLRETTEFRQRFGAIFDAEAKGYAPISPSEVIAYEKQLAALASYNGLPMATGDSVQSMARRLLGNNVSLNEANERMTAQRAFARQVLEDPNQDREAVEALMGQGMTLYDVANFALDPTKTLDEVQRRFEATTIANEAAKTGYRLQNNEAEELARLGVNQQAARQGFGQLAVSDQIVNPLGDEQDPVSREMELAAVAGDVQAISQIERSRQNRLAANVEGGGFATDREGFGGLR